MRQPGNALFLMTSGEARVQKPKRQWRPQLQASMELEAVEVAVRGASEDLISQLGALAADPLPDRSPPLRGARELSEAC